MIHTARQVSLSMQTAEFLDWPGDGSGRKFQLVDGEVRAMSPASATHGNIQATLAYLIKRHLAASGSPCWVATEPAVQPRLRADSNVRVPDLGVTCTPNAPGQQLLPDPLLLIEVLSPGNQADTWDNVWAYATIPTVQDILIVHSSRVGAELLCRQADGTWPETPHQIGPDGTLELASLEFTCDIREVYADTHLNAARPRR